MHSTKEVPVTYVLLSTVSLLNGVTLITAVICMVHSNNTKRLSSPAAGSKNYAFKKGVAKRCRSLSISSLTSSG